MKRFLLASALTLAGASLAVAQTADVQHGPQGQKARASATQPADPGAGAPATDPADQSSAARPQSRCPAHVS